MSRSQMNLLVARPDQAAYGVTCLSFRESNDATELPYIHGRKPYSYAADGGTRLFGN